MRYFLAKHREGPILIVSARIDEIFNWLTRKGLAGQFHPSYTRIVPAHHITELQLIGCPGPDPQYTRFFDPAMATLPPDLDLLAHSIKAHLQERSRDG